MIQIEALEVIIDGRLSLQAGDRLTVDDDIAKRWCGAGWAEAVNGECATGERRVVRAVVEPHSSSHKANATEPTVGG